MGVRRCASNSAKPEFAMEPSRLSVHASSVGIGGRDGRTLLPPFADAVVLDQQKPFRTPSPPLPPHYGSFTRDSLGSGILRSPYVVEGHKRSTFCDRHLRFPSAPGGIGFLDLVGERFTRGSSLLRQFLDVSQSQRQAVSSRRLVDAGWYPFPSRTAHQRSKHRASGNYSGRPLVGFG